MVNTTYKRFAQGIFIVKAKNTSFNSDFSGLPRRLPDNTGTIYATDKALKYCVRKYLEDHNGMVFVWRRNSDEGEPITLEENYKMFIDMLKQKDLLDKDYKIDKDEKKTSILKNLLNGIDVRLFGATFAKKSKTEGESKNVSLTGTVQISYGINKLDENLYYNNGILSPYLDKKEKGKNQQRTLGNETKTLEAHYVYDFVINPNNLIDDLSFLEKSEREKLLLNEGDIKLFKEAMCKGVSYVTSASKIGSESELFMFIEMNSEESKEDKVKSHILPLMKDLVKVESKDGRTVINLGEVFKSLNDNYKNYISSVELYYDDNVTDVVGVDGITVSKKHIVTLEPIN